MDEGGVGMLKKKMVGILKQSANTPSVSANQDQKPRKTTNRFQTTKTVIGSKLCMVIKNQYGKHLFVGKNNLRVKI